MHKPVLLKEVLEQLDLQQGETVVDGTINGGGHAMAMLGLIGPQGRLLGIDRDRELIQRLQERIQNEHIQNISVVHGNFSEIISLTKQCGFEPVQKILLDLGFSSYHVDESERGFSFQHDEPLDMRYNKDSGESARDLLAKLPAEEIADILKQYGEERFARSIARRIIEERKKKSISTTGDLVEIVARSIPGWYRRSRMHFATRTFQALRIAANRELEHISEGVRAAVDLLASGGRIAIISFHSLEDRIVKQTFNLLKKDGLVIVKTKKPIVPSREEIIANPRARSAKLRVAEKV